MQVDVQNLSFFFFEIYLTTPNLTKYCIMLPWLLWLKLANLASLAQKIPNAKNIFDSTHHWSKAYLQEVTSSVNQNAVAVKYDQYLNVMF